MKSALLIDFYDSYSYNLYYQLKAVFNNFHWHIQSYDSLDKKLLDRSDVLVLGPGPGDPMRDSRLVNIPLNWKSKAILGICLGMQIINVHFGGAVTQSRFPQHGWVSSLKWYTSQHKDFKKNPKVMRYNSLQVSALAKGFKVLATADSEIMAIEHHQLPILGFQFHPESFLTEDGEKLLHLFGEKLVSS